MRIGYWRCWASGPKRQRDNLEAAGCDRICGEESPKRPLPLAERSEAIRTLRAGDELVVVAPEVLGRNQVEILEALTETYRMSDGGAVIRDLSTGNAIRWTPEAQVALDFVARGATNLLYRRTSAAGFAARGRAGRKKALQGSRLTAARDDWFNLQMTGGQVAQRYGVTTKTLHDYFGKRRR
ncbi:hypothetical protein [Thalassobaculum litoreum]|uniref:hypothetical protein n=1 Tax=Thalassobaculum litoreum TaxID=420996 RepID=UPI0011133A81|nr:hypothetical protein [Thalassobaculum litoreum]